jgi:hypothetical protein
MLINGNSAKPARGKRGRHFDRTVANLAPLIAQVRAGGAMGVSEIANRLNEQGVLSPLGRQFTHGSMHRILVRMRELHLGQGPRTVSEASSARAGTPHRSPSRNLVRRCSFKKATSSSVDS